MYIYIGIVEAVRQSYYGLLRNSSTRYVTIRAARVIAASIKTRCHIIQPSSLSVRESSKSFCGMYVTSDVFVGEVMFQQAEYLLPSGAHLR